MNVCCRPSVFGGGKQAAKKPASNPFAQHRPVLKKPKGLLDQLSEAAAPTRVTNHEALWDADEDAAATAAAAEKHPASGALSREFELSMLQCLCLHLLLINPR